MGPQFDPNLTPKWVKMAIYLLEMRHDSSTSTWPKRSTHLLSPFGVPKGVQFDPNLTPFGGLLSPKLTRFGPLLGPSISPNMPLIRYKWPQKGSPGEAPNWTPKLTPFGPQKGSNTPILGVWGPKLGYLSPKLTPFGVPQGTPI